MSKDVDGELTATRIVYRHQLAGRHMIGVASAAPADRLLVETLLDTGEQLLHVSPAETTMQRAGIVAVAYAVPALAVGWFPLRIALATIPTLTANSDNRLGFALFTGFGSLWVLIGLRLLYEPVRLHRLYPHVIHALTDHRFLAIDRRSGLLSAFPLAQLWLMKTFSPFGRLTVRRTGFVTETGKSAETLNFDGVRDVEAVAQAIADHTGVPVGFGRAAVAASIARMPPGRHPR